MDQHSQANVQQAYAMACERARAYSARNECCCYVNAVVRKVGGLVFIDHFEVSDWFDSNASVARWADGVEYDVN